MSQHEASIQWQRVPHPLDERTYSRNHEALLNGGQSVNVSASVEYKGDPACADPEQMLVSAVASCHMLTFLAIAEFQKFRVEQYQDNAIGYLEKVEGEGMTITRIELSPKITFGGEKMPDAAALARLHAGAHKNCFIANSLKARVTVVTETATA
ncbi:OsmC family protein [Ramlibacter sp. 2FC]|uniref:OsmC family protein n=1 Tax=Ramlibacter sp. 2FC TaxID=2502188 RepID=UPI0010F790F4|nr:OsmC family protein [Ramlibacter sp. 2FC]